MAKTANIMNSIEALEPFVMLWRNRSMGMSEKSAAANAEKFFI